MNKLVEAIKVERIIRCPLCDKPTELIELVYDRPDEAKAVLNCADCDVIITLVGFTKKETT